MDMMTLRPRDRLSDDQDWKRLQDIMLGDQPRELAMLRERIELIAQQNQVLTERIKLTFQQQAQQMRYISGPATMEWMAQLHTAGVEARKTAVDSTRYLLVSTLEEASRSSPGHLARILTPVLGPTIRSYVKAVFQQLITQLDALMRRANLPQRIWWRIQAARRGMSYAEYVVLQTANYSVVHAALTKRETSELVMEAGNDIPTGENADFMAQSALASALGSQLHPEWETVRIAGKNLALQLRTLGPCPPHVRMRAEHVLQEAEVMLAGHPAGQSALSMEEQEPLSDNLRGLLENSRKPSKPILGMLVFGLLLAACVAWSCWSWWQRRQEQLFLERLSRAPGYVVQQSSYSDGQFKIKGLRDPLAPSPFDYLKESGLDPSRVGFDFAAYESLGTSYESLRESAQAQRLAARDAAQQQSVDALAQRLAQMDTSRRALLEGVLLESARPAQRDIGFSWAEGALRVSGKLPPAQLENLRQSAKTLEKVAEIKLNVDAAEPPAPAGPTARELLERVNAPFVSGTAVWEPHADDILDEMVRLLARCDAEAGPDRAPRLALRSWPIVGERTEPNKQVERNRLEIVRAALQKRGVAASRFGPSVAEQNVNPERQGVSLSLAAQP